MPEIISNQYFYPVIELPAHQFPYPDDLIDCEMDYDGSDQEYIGVYEVQAQEGITEMKSEQQYQDWLTNRYETHYSTTKNYPNETQRRFNRNNYLDSPLYRHNISPTCERYYLNGGK